MVRRQIQLTDEQDAAVRSEAVQRGLSIAAVIRELVEESLRRDSLALHAAASAVIGAHASGRSDVAEQHDDHLLDAFGA